MAKKTCFLIDDDPDDREIFELALENANDSYKCITAKNGINALEMIEADTAFVPDFIFIDLNMPYMTGKECLVQFKKVPRLSHVPIIMYTTSSYQKDVEETKGLGAAHFITKPTALSGLIELLSQIFNGKDIPYHLGGD